MTVCRSAEHARCQREGCLFAMDCLTPDGVRSYSGCLQAFERFAKDECRNFDLEPPPASDFDPASRAVHAAVVARSSTPTKLLTVWWRSGNVRI
jgi:hypothetical protein